MVDGESSMSYISHTQAHNHDPGGKSKPAWPTDSEVEAIFSDCGLYRYSLSEIWDRSLPIIMWVLMNPSVACIDFSDPTLRKTGKFARRWGYGGQLVGNVHAYRATDAKKLLKVEDPVGSENDQHLLRMASIATEVVLAYGKPPRQLQSRGCEVVCILANHSRVSCLTILKDGTTPKHPLYVRDDQERLCYTKTTARN